jgi:MYXO-CTERM domain-containing protein
VVGSDGGLPPPTDGGTAPRDAGAATDAGRAATGGSSGGTGGAGGGGSTGQGGRGGGGGTVSGTDAGAPPGDIAVGGCACTVGARGSDAGVALLGVALAGVLAIARRRRVRR